MADSLCSWRYLTLPARHNQSRDLIIGSMSNIDETVDRENATNITIIYAEKHYVVLPTLYQIPNRSPFQATPILSFIISSEKDHNPLGLVVVNTFKINIE